MKMLFIQLLAFCMVITGAGASAQERDVPESSTQVMLSFSPLVKQVSPAVVNIYTKRLVTRDFSPFGGDPFFEQFFGRGFGGGLSRQQLESSLGTGLIVDPAGLLVTNAHVIKGAQEISVVLGDGREFDAEVSLSDESSDLAVLRINPQEEPLPFAKLKASDSLEVGDIVLAIGNPFGVGQTVTSGIVSALARSSLNVNDFNFFIQTDAAINPGNSGGPLVAMDGSVVGLNTAIYSRSGGSLGIGFAIPSEMVQTVIAAEKSGASDTGVVRPWIGAQGQTVTPDIASSMNLKYPRGVLISALHSASPARKAGLKIGDVVRAINDKQVNDPAEMKFRLATVPIGQKADLEVLRNGETIILKMAAVAPPDNPPRNDTKLEGENPLEGAIVGNINPRVGVELGIDTNREGVVVLSADPAARASRLVRAGDIILSINDNKIRDISALQEVLKKASESRVFDLTTERNGHQSRIVIR